MAVLTKILNSNGIRLYPNVGRMSHSNYQKAISKRYFSEIEVNCMGILSTLCESTY